MSDKPTAKPIQAWAIKTRAHELPYCCIDQSPIDAMTGYIETLLDDHEQPSDERVEKLFAPFKKEPYGAEVVPVTITEGHGDELGRIQTDIAREIRDWMESDSALCGPDPFDLEMLAQRIERGEI